MKIRNVILSLAVLLSVFSCSRGSNECITMFVGTYTGGTSIGIYTYLFNQTKGTASAADSTSLRNPSYLTVSSSGKYVYAVSETSDSTASLNAYQYDSSAHKLKFIDSRPTFGADPCYVSSNGKIALTANYSGGSVTVFPIRADGGIDDADTLFHGNIGGPDSLRQASAHIHCVKFSNDGRYLYASDFSADQILCFKVSEDQGHLSLESSVSLDPDYGTRHIVFDASGRYAYVIGELSGTITVLKASEGTLEKVQTIDADPSDGRGSADIALSPDGRFLYASNRLKNDGIAIFSVDAESGKLASIGYQNTGIHPRNFNITPNGRFLLVACRDSGMIQVFRRDMHRGTLSDTGKNIYVSKPVCIKFLK